MKTALRVTVALSALTLALTGCSSDRDDDSNIESLPTSSASAPATSSASPEETSSAAPETSETADSSEETTEEMPGAEGPPAAGAPMPEEETEENEESGGDNPAAPASQAPVVAPAPIQPPTGADIPKGGGDVTGSLLKASNADKIKDFVKKATVDSEGKVFRTADDGPSVVTVLDTSGAVIATNTPKDKPFEECSWIG